MSGSALNSNTILPPPRLSGDNTKDIAALQRYAMDLYNAFVLINNVLGKLADHEARIAALEGGP